MSANITNQLIEDLKLASTLSIAVDERCGTRGIDIANTVMEWFEKHQIPLEKIVSISTDGAKSKADVRNEFVAILIEKLNHKILTYHCIVHQEALCVQTFPEEICKVMELVIKIINSIAAKALYHRQFNEFLIDG